MFSNRMLPFFIILFLLPPLIQCLHMDLINPYEPRSRMIMLDGNMFFVAGAGKNVTFLVSSANSSISFGDTNILELPNATEVNALRQLVANVDGQLSGIGAQMAQMDSVWKEKQAEILEKHRIFAQQIAVQLNDSQNRARATKRIRLLIIKLGKQIERVFKMMGTDECLGAPCKNGGTCIDGFGKFQCLCPAHFQGKLCDERVDECALYSGTAVGCQNNATCQNNPSSAGISCNCTEGWRGTRCDHRENACEIGSDICGEHGHCLPNSQSTIGYRCLCEAGFKLAGDPANPICVDIDECAQQNPCYPGADCINLPGSFKCGSCPAGLIGNGVQCLDFDECASEMTNDCSKQPMVECKNTHGGYKCGECPPDFEGDGFSCRKRSRCSEPICHPGARCLDEPEFRCECPEGTMGDGIGADGCKPTNDSICLDKGFGNNCLNGGICQALAPHEFRCNCPEGYQGVRCEHPSPCLSRQFCNGHGQCRINPLGCDCFRGFYGPRCQFQEDGCGFHTSNETGELIYERTTPSPLFNRWTCTWHIQLFDTRKVISIQFLNLTAPRLYEITSKSCTNSFVTLTVFDGVNPGQSPPLATKIADFCHGEDLATPFFKQILYTSSNKATIQLSSRLQGRSTFLHFNWTAAEPRCGGRLSNPNGGRIDFFSPEPNETCIWYVNLPPQFHVELAVQTLRLPSDKAFNCSVNSLELFDSPLPANRTKSLELCSTLTPAESPTIMRTSGPLAAIYFRFDRSLLPDECQSNSCPPVGFSLKYSPIELPSGCGGEISLDSTKGNGELEGRIESPNFPHNYFPNLDCLWILRIGNGSNEEEATNGTMVSNIPSEEDPYSADQKVQILFDQFDIPATVTQYANPLLRHVTISSCGGDFVQITELDQTFCNLQKPPNLPISAPQISLKFHSDATISGKGFSLKYKSICQKDFSEPNGTISPPNFPLPSTRPFKCAYRILAKPSQAIRLRFDKIGLQTNFTTCFYHKERHAQMQDYIEFSGGHPSNEVANKRYVCPRFPFVAPGGEMVISGIRPFSITYSSSGTQTNKGFLFSYELLDIGCGGVFNIGEEEMAAGGTQIRQFTSPNYPDSYMSLMYCVYFLRVPTGKAVLLNFDVFDVENVAHREECEFDNVRIYDTYVDEDDHGKLLGKFCGKSLPPPILFESGQMAVVFVSDRSVSGAGFSAKFQPVDLTSHCDRTFTAPAGEFEFDSAQFGQSDHCDYRIWIPTNRRILLSISNISAPCEGGTTLLIRNGPSDQSPGFPGLFRDSEICDEHPISRLISQGNRLFLRFQAGQTRSAHFSIKYEQFETGCGGHVTGFSGALSSPQFPHKDSQSLRCEWLVAVAPGNQIRLQIMQMDELDSEDIQGKCSPFGRNLLEIAEGGTDWSELLQRFCRRELNPLPIQSGKGNSLLVRFSQHGGSHHPAIFGFLAQFSTVCQDIVLEGQQGTLQSPGYPQRVLQPRNCQWTIRTSAGSRIHLQFHLFRITDSTSYMNDFNKFVVNVQMNCRRNYLEIDSTKIARFVGTRGGMAFSLNETNKSGKFANAWPSKYCLGAYEPMELISKGNQLDVGFQSRNEPENHFWLSWRTIGCGGLITQNNSILMANASDGADFVATEQFRKCVWQIRAPIGYKIEIRVERMETEIVPDGKKCFELKAGDMTSGEKAKMRDGVQFYAGEFPFARLNSGAELPLKALCGRVRNETLTWAGPNLAIVFAYHADTSQALADTVVGAMFGTFDEVDDHLVFRARVTFKAMEKAATAEGPSGSGQQNGGIVLVDPRSDAFIQSPNFPQPYPKGIELTWQFEAPEGFRIAFELLNLSSPANANPRFAGGTNRALNSSNPEDYNCGYHLFYLRGGLMFTEGGDNNDLSSLLSPRFSSRYRICQDVQMSPLNFTMNGNLSIVTFRGATYYNMDSPTADSSTASTQISTATAGQKAVGFRLRVFAKCGGQLWASNERKVLNTAKMGGAEQKQCEWTIQRNYSSSEEEDGQKIFVRIEELSSQMSHSSFERGQAPKVEVFCGLESKGIVEAGELSLFGRGGQHFRQFVCDGKIRLVADGLDKHEQTFLITYDIEQTFCGGQLSGHEGRLALSPIPNPVDCEWTVEAVPGAHVHISIAQLVLPVSEFCADAFLEFREANTSGPLIGRFCGIHPPIVESQTGSIWIRLRHKIEEGGEAEVDQQIEEDEEEGKKVPVMELKYTKVYGLTNSHVIESPPAGLNQPIAWRIAAVNSDNWIRLWLTDFELAQFSASLTIYSHWCTLNPSTGSEDIPCQPNDPSALRFSALSLPQKRRIYTVQSNRATIVFWPNQFGQFRLKWEEFGQNAGQEPSAGGEVERSSSVFACGQELIPTYEAQTLNSPRDIESMSMRYKNNERCKWTLRRPHFASIILNVTRLDLEDHPACRYDWMALSTANYETETDLANVPEQMRICRKNNLQKVEVNSADQAFVYFVTDSSRTFGGFTLIYSLSCNSIELWPIEKGLMDSVLQSPNYPDSPPAGQNRTCQWSVLLLSRRDIQIEALDMDMAPRDWQSQECLADSLEFSSTPFYRGDFLHGTAKNKSMVHCGQEKFNLTIQGGYLFIRYWSSQPRGRGFKLRLREIVHDCASSIVQLDQLDPIRLLASPEFPNLSPDSLSCQWILSAPAGHRLQFTVDPHTFNLQNPISEDRCEEDFLEIRDGPSPASPLVGRFCKENAPSTVVSSGEHLNVRYVTDSDVRSQGWNATVELAKCGGSIVLVQGQNGSIQSPNYPDFYPPTARCEWIVKAPKGHFVEAMIEHFWLANTENCTSEYLEIRDKNSTGEFLQKPVCSRLALNNGGNYQSRHQSLHILFNVDGAGGSSSLVSRTSRLFCLNRKCGFRIRLWPSKFECGGTVTDDSGRLDLPGSSAGGLPSGLFCRWDFRAGIAHRYLLELEFPSKRQNAALQFAEFERKICFSALRFYDGFPDENGLFGQDFCPPNSTRFLSKSDISTLIYSDNDSIYRFMLGISNRTIKWEEIGIFVKYTKVPKDFDNSSCNFELTESANLSIVGSSDLIYGRRQNPFCHIQIRNLDHQTVHLQFNNITFANPYYNKFINICRIHETSIRIKDELADPVNFEANFCQSILRKTNQTSLILLNRQLEIYVQNWDGPVFFELAVTFHECGGLIDEERNGMSGELSSPGFGGLAVDGFSGQRGNYSNGLECIWLLRAPEARIVSLEFTSMDLEYHIECGHDSLKVIAGDQPQSSAILHRYCNSESGDEKLPERFRRIRSFGRSLILHFHTDSSVVGHGFSLNYAFLSPNEQCGFNANSPNGTIQSPNFPADYPPNSQCIWDIQAPPGFHLLLTFELFDIVQSPDCVRDFLKISEEHQSRAVSPLLAYYFYFDHESPGKFLCGNILPGPIRTESNRVRLNFTSDARKSGKGFKLRWHAVCGGAVFRNNHGVITSPHYPAPYPDEDAECQYLVDPETQPGTTQIVTLKVLDFDLDTEKHTATSSSLRSTLYGADGFIRFCQSDFLEIRDVLRNVTVQLLCGATFQAETAEAISIKGPIGIRFLTNRTGMGIGKGRRGFKLSYALSECGGDVNLGDQSTRQSTVTISSPSFPLPYHHGLDCVWNVSAPADRIISYKFTDLKIEPSPDCEFDAIEIYDSGTEMNNETRKMQLCGDKAPEGEMKSSGQNMLIRFRTDHSASFDGFRMVLMSTLGPSNGCGGRLNGTKDWQKLGAPIDPQSGNYFANLRCEWIIQVPQGQVVELAIKSLELEQKSVTSSISGQNKNLSIPLADRIPCFDYAAIYDGPKATSPFLLSPICALPENSAGDQIFPTLISSHRRVDVFFSSDSSLELAGGFQVDHKFPKLDNGKLPIEYNVIRLLEFRSIKSDCGGSLLAGLEWAKLNFTSEKTKTRTNQRHKRCRWHIFSDQRQPVEAIFEQFSFPSSTNDCLDEFLEIQDVGSPSECSHPACAQQSQQQPNLAKVKTCGRYAPNWHISSTSIIQLTASVLLQSQFVANFTLRYRALSPCNRTVQIDGNAPDGTSLASGRLISPNYPNSPYSHNETCTTQIEAAEGHRIFLVFKTFELERGRYMTPMQRWRFDRTWMARGRGALGGSGRSTGMQGDANCIYDSLKVMANSTAGPAILCGSWLPSSILSDTNRVQLTLKTDETVAGTGYELSYYSVTISKTPNLQMFEFAPSRDRSGALTSIGYPGSYPPNSVLRASIIPPIGLQCMAKVMTTEFGGDCRARIGRYPARSALIQLDAASRQYSVPDFNNLEWNPWPCSIDPPLKLPIPPGNQLIIEFRTDSDSENDGLGFRLHWDCEDLPSNSL